MRIAVEFHILSPRDVLGEVTSVFGPDLRISTLMQYQRGGADKGQHRRGLVSVDADEDPVLARFVDASGAVVVEEPAAPDLAWLARHSWAWNPARLDELIAAAVPATLYVCGGAANELELADRFIHVFLLEINEPTMLARLDARREYHPWGRIGDTREHLRRFLPGYQDRLRAFGAIRIDARQPLDQVVDAILSRTLAGSGAGDGRRINGG